jgi:hypothetical protein
VNKLRAKLHRQVAMSGRDGVDPSSHAVPCFDQGHPPPGFGQCPGSGQSGNSRANHNRVQCFCFPPGGRHSAHLPSERLGTRALRRHGMLECLDR